MSLPYKEGLDDKPKTLEETMAWVCSKYWNDRVGFVRDVIGVKKIDPFQLLVLEAYDRGDTAVAIKSGKKCGKSALSAWLIIHYMCCRPRPKVVCAAPTKHQIYDVTWSALAQWYRHMKETEIGAIFAAQFVWTKERFYKADEPEEWFAVAMVASKDVPEGMQGIHGDYVMRVREEGSGMSEAAHEALDGDDGNIETLDYIPSNPTRRSGRFYDIFSKLSKFYRLFTWNAELSSISSKRYRDESLELYGRDSNYYRVNVLGEFPLGEGDSFIQWDSATAACNNDLECNDLDAVVLGVDVAYSDKDDSVIAIRQGHYFHPYQVLPKCRGNPTMNIVHHVIEAAKKYKPRMIYVDAIGYGKGVADILNSMGYPAYAVVVNETALDNELYYSVRDELWAAMKTALQYGAIHLSDTPDNKLVGQLTLPTSDFPDGGGVKMKIESKKAMRTRTGQASAILDIADAHNLCFAQPMPDEDRYSNSGFGVQEPITNYEPLDRLANY